MRTRCGAVWVSGLLAVSAACTCWAAESGYEVTAISPQGVECRWPALNNTGDVVWCQRVAGSWQVFRSSLSGGGTVQLTSANATYSFSQYPSVADDGSVLCASYKPSVAWYELLKYPSGEVVEFSTRDIYSAAHRDAGANSGLASNGTAIWYYDFYGPSGALTGRRLSMTGSPRIVNNWEPRDHPDINADDEVVFQKGQSVCRAMPRSPDSGLWAASDLWAAVGARPRISDNHQYEGLRPNGTTGDWQTWIKNDETKPYSTKGYIGYIVGDRVYTDTWTFCDHIQTLVASGVDDGWVDIRRDKVLVYESGRTVFRAVPASEFRIDVARTRRHWDTFEVKDANNQVVGHQVWEVCEGGLTLSMCNPSWSNQTWVTSLLNRACWERKPIPAGAYGGCSATPRYDKPVRPEPRKCIRIPDNLVSPRNGILVHYGLNPTWSKGCIVCPEAEQIYDTIVGLSDECMKNVEIRIADPTGIPCRIGYGGSRNPQVGQPFTLRADLATTNGQPLAGQLVRFVWSEDAEGTVGVGKAEATTDPAGVAVADYTGTQVLGQTYHLWVSFAGDGVYRPAAELLTLEFVTANVVPAATTLGYSGDTSVDALGTLELSARLTSEDGTSLDGKTVQFVWNGGNVFATTDADGVAGYGFSGAKAAGTYPLTISFAGDDEYRASRAYASFEVTNSATGVDGQGKLSYGPTPRAQATFAIAADEGTPPTGSFTITDLGRRKTVVSTTIATVTIDPARDAATITGTCKINGVASPCTLTVTDGAPDTLSFTAGGYTLTGNAIAGGIAIQ